MTWYNSYNQIFPGCRKIVEWDTACQEQIKSLLNKKRLLLRSAETKVKKLREQLSAADRVANAVSMQVAKLHQSVSFHCSLCSLLLPHY